MKQCTSRLTFSGFRQSCTLCLRLGHLAECRSGERRLAEGHLADRKLFGECHFTECRKEETFLAERYLVECRMTENAI